MLKTQNQKKYDLGERTLSFAKRAMTHLRSLPKSISNVEIIKQCVRSSGSIGANYIEAEESLSKKDFVMRVKISRKEAKETIYWLNLIDFPENKKEENESLTKEATELMKIFGSIISKSE